MVAGSLPVSADDLTFEEPAGSSRLRAVCVLYISDPQL